MTIASGGANKPCNLTTVRKRIDVNKQYQFRFIYPVRLYAVAITALPGVVTDATIYFAPRADDEQPLANSQQVVMLHDGPINVGVRIDWLTLGYGVQPNIGGHTDTGFQLPYETQSTSSNASDSLVMVVNGPGGRGNDHCNLTLVYGPNNDVVI